MRYRGILYLPHSAVEESKAQQSLSPHQRLDKYLAGMCIAYGNMGVIPEEKE